MSSLELGRHSAKHIVTPGRSALIKKRAYRARLREQVGVSGGGPANTVEVYDFATDSWSEAAPMPTARGYLAVVAGEDGKIYAIGGTNDIGPLPTVEAYGPSNNTWSAVMPLNTPPSNLAGAPRADEINCADGA